MEDELEEVFPLYFLFHVSLGNSNLPRKYKVDRSRFVIDDSGVGVNQDDH